MYKMHGLTYTSISRDRISPRKNQGVPFNYVWQQIRPVQKVYSTVPMYTQVFP